MSPFREDQYVQTRADQPDCDEPRLSIVKAIILTFERRVPIERLGSLQGQAMLGDVRPVLGWIELDFHDFLCAQ